MLCFQALAWETNCLFQEPSLLSSGVVSETATWVWGILVLQGFPCSRPQPMEQVNMCVLTDSCTHTPPVIVSKFTHGYTHKGTWSLIGLRTS
jgi:hypothetical protein